MCTMAGAVRQPIDIAALERYISHNVPEIQTPIDVKQVRAIHWKSIEHILRCLVVRLWTIEPDIPVDC